MMGRREAAQGTVTYFSRLDHDRTAVELTSGGLTRHRTLIAHPSLTKKGMDRLFCRVKSDYLKKVIGGAFPPWVLVVR